MTETHIDEYAIRVLVCKEDGEFAARALEMDLLAYGATQKEALKELVSLIHSQISFARQMKDDSLIIFPSERQYLDRWEKAHNAALKSGLLGDDDTSVHLDFKAVTVRLDLSKLKQQKAKRFVQVRQQAIA
jgi:hypothetical protein